MQHKTYKLPRSHQTESKQVFRGKFQVIRNTGIEEKMTTILGSNWTNPPSTRQAAQAALKVNVIVLRVYGETIQDKRRYNQM